MNSFVTWTTGLKERIEAKEIQMREIKFRAWDTKRKKMWSAEEMGEDQLTLMPDGRGFVNVNGTSTKLSQFCTHLIPMQFTGHKDKNGTEIYEGDRVKSGSRTGYIRYRADPVSMEFEIKAITGDTWYDSMGPKWSCDEIEVIGNIHTTPELLEQEDGK